jgi:ferric-dicitrate binding protein FerR (iron transport regulator)
MIFALLLLLAAPERLVVMNETVRVPAGEWRPFAIRLKDGAMLDCRFAVERGESGVRLALVPWGDVGRLRERRGHHLIFSTGYDRTGAFRFALDTPGDYALVVDNRMADSEPADVRIRVALMRAGFRAAGRELSPERRAAVVTITSLVFLTGLLWAGWQFRGVWSQRPGQPPPA